jgi:hypothetical protein
VVKSKVVVPTGNTNPPTQTPTEPVDPNPDSIPTDAEPVEEIPGTVEETKAKPDMVVVGSLITVIIASSALLMVLLMQGDKKIKIIIREDNKNILVGKEKISMRHPLVDIKDYLEIYPKDNLEIVISKYVAKRLDRKMIEIQLNNKKVKKKVKYDGKDFIIPIDKLLLSA